MEAGRIAYREAIEQQAREAAREEPAPLIET
jgi:hypothetical protein